MRIMKIAGLVAVMIVLFIGAAMAVEAAKKKASGSAAVAVVTPKEKRSSWQVIDEVAGISVVVLKVFEGEDSSLFKVGNMGMAYLRVGSRSSEQDARVPLMGRYGKRDGLPEVKPSYLSDKSKPFFGVEVATAKYAFYDDKGIKVLEDTVFLGARDYIYTPHYQLGGAFGPDNDGKVFFLIKLPDKSGIYDFSVRFDNTNVKKTVNVDKKTDTKAGKEAVLFFSAELWEEGVKIK